MGSSRPRTPSELKESRLVRGLLREGECTPDGARKILEVLDDPEQLAVWNYEFNVHLVYVDFEHDRVWLEDDLDASAEGRFLMSVEELRGLMAEYVAEHDLLS